MPGFLTPKAASPTIGTSEYSLYGLTTTGVPLSHTDEVAVTAVIDWNALGAADVFELRIYEKANSGTQRLAQIHTRAGVQPGPLERLFLGHFKQGWDVTLRKVSGTDRGIPFTLLLVG